MKLNIALLTLLPVLATAHSYEGARPGADVKTPAITDNGGWTYEAVPGWGVLPDGAAIGPTHGGVLTGPTQKIYLTTDSEFPIIVWDPDGTFVKTIASECQGFHAMQVGEEDGKTVIYGEQNNGNGNRDGEVLAIAELKARVVILDKSGTPLAFLGDNQDRKQWAKFKVRPARQQIGIFTAPHGLAFASNGDLYVQDWNRTGRVTKL